MPDSTRPADAASWPGGAGCVHDWPIRRRICALATGLVPIPTMALSDSLAPFSTVVGGALRLQAEAFRDVHHAGPFGAVGVWIALLAGFSQAIGQAFILFVNRVRPLRFALCLVVEAVLFLLGFLAWALSTWLVIRLLFAYPITPMPVIRALGVAHAPRLLAFLGALPYLGVPWLNLLSFWTAIAFVVGLVGVTGLAPWSVFSALVAGWFVMHVLQRSAGLPVMRLGHWLLDRAAGTPVLREKRQLRQFLADESSPPAPPGRR
ncbi:MAG: hypothetical protein NTZ40_08020 [Cyanobacteria bacterium]|nr:hypothetical protein [Cyanobacteriota bacterium]